MPPCLITIFQGWQINQTKSLAAVKALLRRRRKKLSLSMTKRYPFLAKVLKRPSVFITARKRPSKSYSEF